ncbi:MAG TPA: hypothetical protein VEJ39_05690 [Candidatus Acidoferrales bacterium]|nr:hypothetical protein [Candidatus Acidoferrales bacterium]
MRTICVVGAMLAVLLLAMPSTASAQIGVSITIAPPALPIYVQPICPEPGYMWTPGYWAWGPDGYFWVPGTWVPAPAVGLLWTPGYWGWGGGVFLWHVGYWGPHVGFYGGVNYGFGYGGVGFAGGEWRNGGFFYNRAVSNVNVTVIHNTFNTTVVNNNVSHVSFNGGNGGLTARPTAQEEAWGREQHTPPTSFQTQQEHAASTNHDLLASVNHGRPAVAATAKPGDFSHGAVAARAAGGANAGARANANEHADRPPAARNNGAASTAKTERSPASNPGHTTNNARSDRPPSSNTSHPANNARTDRPPSSSTSHPSTTSHNAPAEHTQTSHAESSHTAPAQHTQSKPAQHTESPKPAQHTESAKPAQHTESKPPAHEEKPH